MQQYLPLAVLKHHEALVIKYRDGIVATVLTACGIETRPTSLVVESIKCVATVLTACGIETDWIAASIHSFFSSVATVLTACGIETLMRYSTTSLEVILPLQQYLPLAVLKLTCQMPHDAFGMHRCNSTYRLRY